MLSAWSANVRESLQVEVCRGVVHWSVSTTPSRRSGHSRVAGSRYLRCSWAVSSKNEASSEGVQARCTMKDASESDEQA